MHGYPMNNIVFNEVIKFTRLNDKRKSFTFYLCNAGRDSDNEVKKKTLVSFVTYLNVSKHISL